MPKTVPLNDYAHALIVNKQKELKKRRNITVRISDFLAMYVKYGVENTEKLLGFRDDEKPNITDGKIKGNLDNKEHVKTEEEVKADN